MSKPASGPRIKTVDTKQEDAIWNGGSAREILREARRKFHETGNNVEFAVAHYSLVKRYMRPRWKAPLAVWHMWRAVFHAKVATWSLLTADGVDVVSRILFKAPRVLGGDRDMARLLIQSELLHLGLATSVMQPHTRALLHITLGEIMLGMMDLNEARVHFSEARAMEPFITNDRQRCRVLIALGDFYLEHDQAVDGMEFLQRAAPLVANVARDQLEKIIRVLAKHSAPTVEIKMREW